MLSLVQAGTQQNYSKDEKISTQITSKQKKHQKCKIRYDMKQQQRAIEACSTCQTEGSRCIEAKENRCAGKSLTKSNEYVWNILKC